MEQRIQSLEANVRYLNERIDAAIKKINESERWQSEAIDRERRERSSEDGELSTMLERSETGGASHIRCWCAVAVNWCYPERCGTGVSGLLKVKQEAELQQYGNRRSWGIV